jgi:hypothetical protein
MPDLMMNVHTTRVLLLTLLTPWCMSYHYVCFNDECTHMFKKSLQIPKGTTDNTPYTMVRSLCQMHDECTRMFY